MKKIIKKIIIYFVGERTFPYWRYIFERNAIKKSIKKDFENKKQLQYPTKVAIIFLGTNKYIRFFPKYYKTIKEKFLTKTPKEFFVFTDKIEFPFLKDKKDINIIKIKHEKWPYIVLKTYEYINSIKGKLKKYSHVIFLDADMYIHSPVSEKEFFCHNKPLFTVQQPNFVRAEYTIKNAPFEKNPKSQAYVGKDKDKSIYIHSVLFGGQTKYLLKLSKELNKRIKEDLKKGVIAQWHDESHLNKYVIENRDLFHIYSLAYAYPEKRPIPKPFKKKICSVSKVNPIFHKSL